MDVLARYGGTLPVLAYDVYNRWIKCVAIAAGVQKHISTHIGRHTFATSVAMASGIPIETVARMLGHKHISTTQIYAKVLPENVLSGYEKIKTNLKEKAVI
jgi:site-specific recombinase XerD